MDQSNIRNFAIIAHIDHGKSTLADRLLEKTNTVSAREMRSQILDSMDLEREKGITIKLTAVRMEYNNYILNLIDTPGHVDFSYEVSRSLAACEGALLIVDATQGIQAQTLANVYKAIEQNLVLIPIINKIDLPNANKEGVAQELIKTLGFKKEDILYASAKDGTGVEEILEVIVKRVPQPKGDKSAPLRALVFDSSYDQHKGVVALIRIVDGGLAKTKAQDVVFMGTNTKAEIVEVGTLTPKMTPTGELSTGEVGYLVTGLKDIKKVQVGDTVTTVNTQVEALVGYEPAKPMVFAGLYPVVANEFENLKKALEKLGLSDAALTYKLESSEGLGRGYRCGFLGMLHLEIIKERLQREHNVEVVIATPSVLYKVVTTKGEEIDISRPQDLPEQYREIKEPWVKAEIITPESYLGNVMELCTKHRGKYVTINYFGEQTNLKRAQLSYELPLTELLTGFYDKLKSVSSGYASLDYEVADYRQANAVKLDILIHGSPVEPLSQIVLRDDAPKAGREVLIKLKKLLPRQQFKVALQAVIGGKIVARETLSAVRKDVTAKLYGGDVTRKQKLLKKQAKGKARLGSIGSVQVPPETFFEVLAK